MKLLFLLASLYTLQETTYPTLSVIAESLYLKYGFLYTKVAPASVEYIIFKIIPH
jgi:hypothetical protein